MYVLNFWDGRLWLVGPMGQVSRCLRSPDEQADRDFLPGLPRDSKVGRSATRRMAGLVGFRVGIAQS